MNVRRLMVFTILTSFGVFVLALVRPLPN